MSFDRIALESTAGLYEWRPGTGAAAVSGWAGYLLTAGADAAPALTAQSAWEDYWGIPSSNVNGGIYLFAPEAPPDPAGFLKRLLAYVTLLNQQASNFAYRYFLWIENPRESSDIKAQLINFARSGDGQRGSVVSQVNLTFRNILLQVSAGVDVLADYAAPAFALRPFGAAVLQFLNTIGQVTPFGSVAGPATVELGAAPGRLTVTMQVSALIPEGANDLRIMRTGVQYFRPGTGNQLLGQLYPVLNKTGSSQVFMQARIDPLHPLDATRTAFTFVNADDGTPPPRFETYLTTDRGHTVWMTPRAGEAGFVLQPELYPVEMLQGEAQMPTYYFAPTGPFAIAYNPEPPQSSEQREPVGPANLLCGLAGVEVITFDPPGSGYEGDILRFVPDQPAYAPVFPLPPVNLRAPNSPAANAPLLTAAYTTAWATISRGQVSEGAAGPAGPNRYYSQPNGAPYYGQAPGAGPGGGGPPMLAFAPTETAELHGGTDEPPFPLVPYSGAHISQRTSSSPTDMADFESQIISPTRKQQILQIKERAGVFAAPRRSLSAAETKTITTPQGLLATVAAPPATQWETLLLARNVVNGTTYNLAFSQLDQVLQDAFQTNQQFLVMTKKPNTAFQNVMSIDGWPFRINVGEGNTLGDYQNVLIFKFMRGRLSDLVKNPSNWTAAAQFNQTEGQGLAFLSQWLQDYIEQARQMAAFEQQQGGRESYFQHFLDIVDSETWNGILALKVDIDLAGFPPVLRGLTAGIDLTRFHAHHFGVEVNFVQAGADGKLDIAGNSSLFGLIYYMDAVYETQLSLGGSPDRPVPAPGDYDFKVLTLKVLFENTAVKTFESKLQVTVNRWFGDQVVAVVGPDGTSLGLPSNSIILDGAYEEHDGQPVFTFSSRGDQLFRLGSNALGVVEAVQTQFSTLTDHGGPAGDQVQSRFTFTCLLNFLPATGFDLFSFGTDWTGGKPGSGQGLYAYNLYLDLAFPAATPAKRTFTFDPGAMAVNLEQSRVRPDSFFQNFPLKLIGLITGTSDQGPAKLGYLPVSMEGPAFTGLKGDWHGLLFQLDLGTMGALAENAGLTAQLLAAWSPGSGGTQGTYDVQVGLKLPGTGGEGKLLSLQGVLKLAIDDIQLLKGETQDHRPAYLLRLTQIGLKFLGIKFPMSGNTVFFLFGDPNRDAPQNSLGWYASYNKEKPPKVAAAVKGGEPE